MKEIAQKDMELLPWLLGVLRPEAGAGHFLHTLAEAALRADWENYPILRPVLLQIKAKYPKYDEEERARMKVNGAL